MPKTVNVRIFGREEAISCEEHEVKDLIRAAEMLDAEMNKTKEAVRQTMPFDRICLLSSLNLVNRLLISEQKLLKLSGRFSSILELRQPLDEALRKPNSDAETKKAKSA